MRGTCLVSFSFVEEQEKLGLLQGFNPRVRGTCLVSSFVSAALTAFHDLLVAMFQSPCAGNMFGKRRDVISPDTGPSAMFQSPCAGNMFGKGKAAPAAEPPTVPAPFQSPCAGNMFGKYRFPSPLVLRSPCKASLVSIPVCGEHVW